MATSQVAYLAEQVVGHDQEHIKQDVANYSLVGDSSETMKALVWQGKQKVQVGMSSPDSNGLPILSRKIDEPS